MSETGAMATSDGDARTSGLSGGVCFVAAFGLAGAGAAFVAQERTTAARVEQPLGFSHRVHVEDQELECSACHAHAAREARAGFPDAAVCRLCHADAQGEGAEEARLVQMLADEAPLVWGSAFRQPAHVYYSHARHVTVARLECAQCHGDIAASAEPPPTQRALRMEECVACHEQRGVTVDCTACHR